MLAVVGSFLAWAEISAGPFTEQAKGVDGWEGKATIVAGAVMVAAGIRVLTGSHQAMARLRPSAAIGGLVAVGVGLYTVLTIRDQLVEAAATELPRAEVERALDSGLLGLTIGIGLYLVIAGGVVALAGGIAGLRGVGAGRAAVTGTLSATPPPPPAGTEHGDVPSARSPRGSDSQADVGAS